MTDAKILARKSDEELLKRIVSGDEEAFLEVYRIRHPAVFRFAMQMSGSRSIAEDVTQEVFIALMQDAGRFDSDRGSLSGYLYGIARNHVLRRIDRDRLLIPLEQSEPGESQILDRALIVQNDPLRDLTRNEDIERVRNAVLALPAHYREVVVLCELHEMSYKDAAEVTGCAVGTVRSRLHRARALLMEKLRDADGDQSQTLNSARCFA